MPQTAVESITVVVVGLVGALAADYLCKPQLSGICKMIASTGFLLEAWMAGATHSWFGICLFAGLILSWWGDLFLISKEKAVFLAGLVSFLLAHVAYIAAFAVHGVAISGIVGSVLVLIVPIILIQRWLSPHVTADMKLPVLAYMTVISAMLCLAVGARFANATWLIPAGAFAFFISDIFVARQRFVAPGFSNRLIGLPLYFLGQVLLALSPAWQQ